MVLLSGSHQFIYEVWKICFIFSLVRQNWILRTSPFFLIWLTHPLQFPGLVWGTHKSGMNMYSIYHLITLPKPDRWPLSRIKETRTFQRRSQGLQKIAFSVLYGLFCWVFKAWKQARGDIIFLSGCLQHPVAWRNFTVLACWGKCLRDGVTGKGNNLPVVNRYFSFFS